jgi:hypothetical protein
MSRIDHQGEKQVKLTNAVIIAASKVLEAQIELDVAKKHDTEDVGRSSNKLEKNNGGRVRCWIGRSESIDADVGTGACAVSRNTARRLLSTLESREQIGRHFRLGIGQQSQW